MKYFLIFHLRKLLVQLKFKYKKINIENENINTDVVYKYDAVNNRSIENILCSEFFN